MQIRLFTTSDRASLSVIYLGCREAAEWWQPKEDLALADFDRDTAGETILVACREGAAVGFAALWMPDSFLHHLFVAPASQGNGVGTALLREALALLGRPARLKCVVANTRACSFYEANGFRVEATAEGPAGPHRVCVLP